MTSSTTKPNTNERGATPGNGEAAGRERGYEDKGGKPGNDLLEDGQLRGVDEDGRIVQGTHGGPKGDSESDDAAARRQVKGPPNP
jgi:hypothetical protein